MMPKAVVLDYEKFWRSIMPETDGWPALPGRTRVVTRYAEPKQLVEVAELIFKHGYKENDAKGFLGENFLRVARQVWN